MITSLFRRSSVAFAIALLVAARPLQAQGDIVSQAELDTPPRLASQEVTARLLARSYPPALKRQGVTGTVQLTFVVDAAGKVEPSSVRVVESSSEQLAEAAKSVIGEVRFRPGVKDGQPVRSVVTLPIAYQ